MSELKIKHRLFENVEEKENYILATYKNKTYEITKFEPRTEEGDALSYLTKRISTSGIKSPKLFFIDKKQGYIVKEHLEGITIMELISKEDLNEDIYSQLFQIAYLAKINRMTLNYEIDNWLLVDNVLYYTLPDFIMYNEEKDLVKKYLRLWFVTKDLVTFLSNHGLSIDKNRIKDEYTVNKEMVLMTIKHYK